MLARIVLSAADGVALAKIARRFSISRQTVINWRARYEAAGIPGFVRRGPLGSASHPGPRQPDLGHAGATTEEIRCHTLEFAAVGPAFGDRLRHRADQNDSHHATVGMILSSV